MLPMSSLCLAILSFSPNCIPYSTPVLCPKFNVFIRLFLHQAQINCPRPTTPNAREANATIPFPVMKCELPVLLCVKIA